jgi:UrcA family protein
MRQTFKETIMNTSKHAASLAVVCAAGLVAAVAMADEPAPSVTLHVPQPLDKVHAAELYKRIQLAAQQVCEPLDGRELARLQAYKACVTDAVARAVAQVDSSELNAVHLAQASGNPRL